jgi:hypothetical protein
MTIFRWILERVSGNALWDLIKFLLVTYVLVWLRSGILRCWNFGARQVQKWRHRPPTHVYVAEKPRLLTLDSVGTLCLVVVLLLLGVWNRKIERDNDLLHSYMLRYVLPRHLSQQQINDFGAYLKSHTEPHEVTIYYINGDIESQEFAEDVANAFRAGEWLPNWKPLDPTAISCSAAAPSTSAVCRMDLRSDILEGQQITQKGPLPEPATIEEKLHPHPLFATMADAVRAAHLNEFGSGNVNSSDPPGTVTVFIGHRRRDAHAIFPPNFPGYGTLKRDINDSDFLAD